MPRLDRILLPSISAETLLALENHLLRAAASGELQGALVLASLDRRYISIGRYHFYGGLVERAGIAAMRRLTGGRVVGAGEGWLHLALVARSVSAMLPPRDSIIRPYQVLNRYTRGILEGMRALGLDCFYSGRDMITCGRREIAMCTFEVDGTGAMLFEASIALRRGLEETVSDLEQFDPEGEISFAMRDESNCTTIARETDANIGFARAAEAMSSGYAKVFGEVASDPAPKITLTPAGAQARKRWLQGRRRHESRLMVGRIAGQLGQVEALVGTDNGVIKGVALGGDFLANSAGVETLERSMRGVKHDLPSVAGVVRSVYGDGSNFILGLGGLENLVKLIADAA